MKIALIGYGKMGKAIEKIAIERGHSVELKMETSDELSKLLDARLDIVFEFTTPTSATTNIRFCLENNLRVVSGTTGWLDQFDQIAALCNEQNGTFLHASNFSIGVNLFFELNDWLAKRMSNLDFHCQIEETHHTEKVDSPSGTAIKLAEGIQNQNQQISGWTNEVSTDQTKLSIISKRLPNVPGIHSVSYSSKLESIRIEHIAHDRRVFATGAVLAAEWIQKKQGLFSMTDFIKDIRN